MVWLRKNRREWREDLFYWDKNLGKLLRRILPEKGEVEFFECSLNEQSWTVRVHHENLEEESAQVSLWLTRVCDDFPEEEIVKVYILELQNALDDFILREFRHGFLTVVEGFEPTGYWAVATENKASLIGEMKGWVFRSEDACLISWEKAGELLGHDLCAIVEEPKPWSPPSPGL